MKVGIDAKCLSEKLTGIEYSTISLMIALKNLGVGVKSFYPKNILGAPIEGIESHVFRTPLPIPLRYSLASLLHSKCFESVDLMHFPHPRVLYGKKPRVPLVLTVHDLIPLKFPSYTDRKEICNMKYILPRYLREVDAIIAVSQTTANDLIHFFPFVQSKVHVVPWGLPFKEESEIVEKKRILLYVGTLGKRKNIPGILEAFAQIQKWGFDYQLVLAGNGEIPPNPPPGVVYKGYVSDEEKIKLMKEATLLIWPSLYEGFGLPLLEAMHYGTPVVTSNCSSMPEVVGDAGIQVDPHSPKAIAEGMAQILSSKEVAKECVRKGFARAKLFSIERMGKETLKVYEFAQGQR